MNEIATSLGRVFWGLLLVILDIRLNHLDLLPDFIGYILVAVGLGGLTGLSDRFEAARTCAWVLVPISVAALVPWGELGLILGLIPLGLNCAMMWFLLGGIMDYTAAQGRPDLAERASNRRVAYVFLMCFVTFLALIARGVRAPVVLLGTMTIICLVALLVMILHLIYRVRTEVAGTGT